MRRALAIGLFAVLSTLGIRVAGSAPRPDCDRACLTGFLDRYVAALLAHDPGRLPVARDIRFTENLVPLRFGSQGLWATVNGRRDFNLYAVDPQRGDAVWIGILKENDKPVMVAIRLKILGDRITESETLVGRSGLTAADQVAGPRLEFSQPIPAAAQATREQLIAIANSNWDAMEQGNGRLAPYAVDCERYDNGRKTTQGPSPPPLPGTPPAGGDVANAADHDVGELGCFGQMDSGRFRNGSRVQPRRIWAVDRQYGLVVGLFTPNVPGTVRTLHLRNGKTLTVGPDELIPFTIEQVEMFRIVNGQISKVEVVLGPRVPYGMRSPFDMKSLWEPR